MSLFQGSGNTALCFGNRDLGCFVTLLDCLKPEVDGDRLTWLQLDLQVTGVNPDGLTSIGPCNVDILPSRTLCGICLTLLRRCNIFIGYVES